MAPIERSSVDPTEVAALQGEIVGWIYEREIARLSQALDLDALEARAVDIVTATYGPMFNDDARFWIQKGIEGMRLAVALAVRDE